MIRLQSENGLLYVPMFKSSLKGIKNSGYLWSRSIVSYIEQGMAIESGNGINRLLNLLLHRTAPSAEIKLRTMTDLVRRHGSQYIVNQVSWGNRVLEEHGWDPETALPYEGTTIDYHSQESGTSWVCCGNVLENEQEKAVVDNLIKDINSRRLPCEQIPSGSIKPYQVEPDDSLTTVIWVFTDMHRFQFESDTLAIGSKPSFFSIWRSRFLVFLRFQLLPLRSIFMHLAMRRMSWTESVLSSSDLTAAIIF